MKNNFHVNGNTKRPISATLNRKPDVAGNGVSNPKPNMPNAVKNDIKYNKVAKTVNQRMTMIPKVTEKKTLPANNIKKDIPMNKAQPIRKPDIPSTKVMEPTKNLARKSLAPKSFTGLPKPTSMSRKSLQPPKSDVKVI